MNWSGVPSWIWFLVAAILILVLLLLVGVHVRAGVITPDAARAVLGFTPDGKGWCRNC